MDVAENSRVFGSMNEKTRYQSCTLKVNSQNNNMINSSQQRSENYIMYAFFFHLVCNFYLVCSFFVHYCMATVLRLRWQSTVCSLIIHEVTFFFETVQVIDCSM